MTGVIKVVSLNIMKKWNDYIQFIIFFIEGFLFVLFNTDLDHTGAVDIQIWYISNTKNSRQSWNKNPGFQRDKMQQLHNEALKQSVEDRTHN